MKEEKKQIEKEIRVFGQWLAHARISLHTQERLCVHKFLPRNPKNTKARQNLKTGILTT